MIRGMVLFWDVYFYRYYSGRYYVDGAMMNGPPKSGYLGGGLTHGWSNNEHPTPFYNFLHAGIDPLAVDALMTTGHMPTMKSQATWMTGASARMPAALGLVAFPSAAQMCPDNTDYWTRKPWSAPAHAHTPRFESIPLHEPDGTGTGEWQEYGWNYFELIPKAVDEVFGDTENDVLDILLLRHGPKQSAKETTQSIVGWVRDKIPAGNYTVSWREPNLNWEPTERGTTYQELLASLTEIRRRGGTITSIVIKGHGGPYGVIDVSVRRNTCSIAAGEAG
jgi:hypothetical protein